MQKFGSAIKTTTLIVGVLLCIVATLDAAPPARDTHEADNVLSTAKSIFTAEKCARLLFNELGVDYQLVLNVLHKTLTKNDDILDKCAVLTKIILQIMHPSFYTEEEEPQRLEILEMLARLGQNMIRDDLENSKRGLGFGMDRGFSGQQAAKHLMGLHAATWAGGPGRRRRSDSDDVKRGVGFGMDRGFSGQQAARYLMGAEAASRVGKRESGEPEE